MSLQQEFEGQHPKAKEEQPEFKEQELLQPPGLEKDMSPRPDHGEESYKGFGRLKDKVALITGGDSGIGRAVALAFAREGAHVAINYLNEEEEDARESANWVEKAGVKCLKVPGDISEESFCVDLVRKVIDTFGRIDVLVNNAAFQMSHENFEDFTSAEIDRTFKTNIYSMFWLSREAVKHMKEGSSIINTSSIQAFQPNPHLLHYATTKAAIVNFTKGLAQLLIDRGIRVNSVAPGPVWTPLIPTSFPEEKVEKFGKQKPFERPAQPCEMSPLFVFLATEDSRYMTGEVIGATGGKTPF